MITVLDEFQSNIQISFRAVFPFSFVTAAALGKFKEKIKAENFMFTFRKLHRCTRRTRFLTDCALAFAVAERFNRKKRKQAAAAATAATAELFLSFLSSLLSLSLSPFASRAPGAPRALPLFLFLCAHSPLAFSLSFSFSLSLSVGCKWSGGRERKRVGSRRRRRCAQGSLLSLTEMPNTCGITIQLSGPSVKEKDWHSAPARALKSVVVYRFQVFARARRALCAKAQALLTARALRAFLLAPFLSLAPLASPRIKPKEYNASAV